MEPLRPIDRSSDSTQRGCTLWLFISCVVLSLTTASVFGWGLGAPNMYNQYTELFLIGKNPCKNQYEIPSLSNTSILVNDAIIREINLVRNAVDNSSIINPDIQKSSHSQEQSNFVKELIKGIPQTIYLIGAIIGALQGPYWLKRLDRKQTILINYMFTFASSLCMLLSYYFNYPFIFYLSRLLLGYQSGMACVIIPPYVTELASQRVRGKAGSVFRLCLTIGIVLGQITGMPFIAGNCDSWSWGLAIIFLLPFIGLFILFFIPNSPTQMISKYNNEDQARKDLRKLRGTEDVEADICLIHQQIQQRTSGSQSKHLSILTVLTSDRHRWPMLTTTILQWAQAIAGINAIFFYSSKMFLKAGIKASLIPYANIGTGLVNMISTAIALVLMERAGRRPLLIYSMSLMIVVFAALTFLVEFNEHRNDTVLALLAVILILVFIASYGMGLGPILFFYASEVCRPEARDSIQAFSFVVNYFANILISLLFPALNSILGGYVFLIFLVLLLPCLIFTWFKVPETKNKAIEEIERFWMNTEAIPQDSLLLPTVKA